MEIRQVTLPQPEITTMTRNLGLTVIEKRLTVHKPTAPGL